MASLNKVFLIGNLTRDPELRYTAGGTAVADVNIAVNQRFVNRNKNEQRDEVVYVAVTVWGKQAEACGEYLTKGSSLFVEGRLQLDTWEGKDGQKKNRLRVVAQRVQFIGKPKAAKSGVSSRDSMSQDIPEETSGNVNEEEIESEVNNEGNDGVPF